MPRFVVWIDPPPPNAAPSPELLFCNKITVINKTDRIICTIEITKLITYDTKIIKEFLINIVL